MNTTIRYKQNNILMYGSPNIALHKSTCCHKASSKYIFV